MKSSTFSQAFIVSLGCLLSTHAFPSRSLFNHRSLSHVSNSDIASRNLLKPRDDVPSSDDTKKKGDAQWDILQSGCVPDSPVATVDDLKSKGWVIPDYKSQGRALLNSATAFFGVNNILGGSDFHQRWATWGDGDNKALYGSTYSPMNGVIIAQDQIKGGATDFWSDVTFSIWKDTCEGLGGDVKNLQWVVRHQVKNTIAEQRIIDIGGSQEVRPGDDKFGIMLGVPNVAGVVRMLYQHKQDLGPKTIEKIVIGTIEIDGETYPEIGIKIGVPGDPSPFASL